MPPPSKFKLPKLHRDNFYKWNVSEEQSDDSFSDDESSNSSSEEDSSDDEDFY